MGAKCVSICMTLPDKKPVEFRDTLPNDINSFHPDRVHQKLPKLSFEGSISNIKIINCPQASFFSVKIKIDDIIQIDLPKRKVEHITQITRQSGQQIVFVQNQLKVTIQSKKWLSQQKISFMMDQFELRSHFLNVYVYDEDKNLQSNIRVNLYAIVTGPYRHDFYINLQHHPSRLLFEINLSEKIEAKLQPLSVRVQLEKNYFSQSFNFLLKQLTHGQVISTSKPSSSQTSTSQTSSQKDLNRQPSPDILRETDSPMLKRKKIRYYTVAGNFRRILTWISPSNHSDNNNLPQNSINLKLKESLMLKKKLPHLKVHILSNEIAKSIIKFSLWISQKKDMKDLPLKIIQKDSIIFGSIQFNLNKIFDEQYQQMDAKDFIQETELMKNPPNYKLQMRNFVRQGDLISKQGQFLGKCWLKFRLTNPKFFKQLSYCVKTQDGTINMTTAFKNYSGKSSYIKNPAIKDIIGHSVRIHNLTKKLSIMQTTITSDRRDVVRVQRQILEQFEIMKRELINSCSSSYVLSSSNLQIQLLEAQDALIQVLEQLYAFLFQKSGLFKDICWEIAVNIYKRGQFFLQNIGFKDFQKKQLIQASSIKQKKIAVGLRFKCILYRFLIFALQEEEKPKIVNKTDWFQCFKAFSYFRIPIYRDEILNYICKSKDQHQIQLKIPNFDQLGALSSKFKTQFEKTSNHLDWKYYFYKPLQSKQQAVKLDRQLTNVLQTNRWIKSLHQKSTEFYLFVGYLVKILGQIGRTLKIIKWKYFPGYTYVVKCFLIEMKKQQLKDYSSILIRSSINLLANQQLINVLMPLIIDKTDMNDHQSLSMGMSLIWNYFDKVTQNRKQMLPQTFDYLYFYKMIKIILESDNGFAIGKVLILMEYFFKSFNEEFKQNLAMYLMGKVFFKLFFHWSYAIRMIFHVILVSKIFYHLIKHLDEIEIDGTKTKQAFLAHHELQQRYADIMQLIYSADKVKKSERNVYFYKHCFKQLHKKMKKKMAIKKSIRSGTNPNWQRDFQFIFHTKSQYSLENLMKQKYNFQGLQKNSYYFINASRLDTGSKRMHKMKSGKDSGSQSQKAIVHRGGSFIEQDVGFEKCLKKFDTAEEMDQEDLLSPTQISILEKTKTNKAFSNSSDKFRLKFKNQQKPEKFKSMKIFNPQNTKIKKKINYTYFGSQDHNLEEMTDIQIRQIHISMKQFRISKDKIDKFVMENGRMPQFDFNVELQTSGDFEADFFKWQH